MKKQKGHLENWSVYETFTDAILLEGIVSGHSRPDLQDGMHVHTSRVKRLDTLGRTATTLNTEYTLGKPHPGWLSALETSGRKLSELDRPRSACPSCASLRSSLRAANERAEKAEARYVILQGAHDLAIKAKEKAEGDRDEAERGRKQAVVSASVFIRERDAARSERDEAKSALCGIASIIEINPFPCAECLHIREFISGKVAPCPDKARVKELEEENNRLRLLAPSEPLYDD